MQIRRIDLTSKQDTDQFVMFPFELYHRCRQWVPPLISGARKALTQHPFFEHSQAEFFVAESSHFRGKKKTLGRIAVMDNRRYNQYAKSHTAFFGFFDCVDEPQVAQALFMESFEWARRRQLDRIIGPRGLMGSDSTGVLVEGFEHQPVMEVSYNYPYYDALVRSAGFQKDTDHLSGYVSADQELPSRLYEIAEKIKARRGFSVKSFLTKDELKAWAPKVIEVYFKSFVDTHIFFPPTETEAHYLADSIISVADPRLIKLVMKDEHVVGFLIAYPDLSEGLQLARGRLWPFGWAALLQASRHSHRMIVNGGGLLPEYQGLGGNILFYVELDKTARRLGYTHAEGVMVNEQNFASLGDNQRVGVKWYKRHRCYWKNL